VAKLGEGFCPLGGALCKRQLLALTFVTHRVSSK